MNHLKRLAVLVDPRLSEHAKKVVLRAAHSCRGLGRVAVRVFESELPIFRLRLLYFGCDAVVTTGGYDHTVNSYPLRRLVHFSVDPNTEAMAQWNWFRAMNAIAPYAPIGPDSESAIRLREAFRRLRLIGLRKAYIFGTGPSLELASQADFSDGYRVVCNTIVCDKHLFNLIAPHVIVAGDALYHFGDSEHACRFRRDLLDRMRLSDSLFLYPEMFQARVHAEFGDVIGRCFPLGAGSEVDFTIPVDESAALPAIGNVLGYMLLPVACSLSTDVSMLGFDGRRPDDTNFWRNAPRISFPELIAEMRQEYPAFYENFVPAADPNRYVNTVHGDELSSALQFAQLRGWSFTMLSPSTSPALRDLPVQSVIPE
jgi:hypothetical protein